MQKTMNVYAAKYKPN